MRLMKFARTVFAVWGVTLWLCFQTGEAQQPNNRTCDAAPAIKVATFESLSPESDKAKLLQIIPVMEAHAHSHGFIVTYAGRGSTLAEAQRRADRAKRQVLEKQEWINQSDGLNSRLNTHVCGFRETPAIELWVTPVGAAPPICAPTVIAPETPPKRVPRRRR